MTNGGRADLDIASLKGRAKLIAVLNSVPGFSLLFRARWAEDETKDITVHVSNNNVFVRFVVDRWSLLTARLQGFLDFFRNGVFAAKITGQSTVSILASGRGLKMALAFLIAGGFASAASAAVPGAEELASHDQMGNIVVLIIGGILLAYMVWILVSSSRRQRSDSDDTDMSKIPPSTMVLLIGIGIYLSLSLLPFSHPSTSALLLGAAPLAFLKRPSTTVGRLLVEKLRQYRGYHEEPFYYESCGTLQINHDPVTARNTSEANSSHCLQNLRGRFPGIFESCARGAICFSFQG